MRRLEDMSLDHRVALTTVIVLVILFALALFGYLTGGWDRAEGQTTGEPILYQGIPIDAMLLRLDKRALDEAYHSQLLKLFSVWLSQQAPVDAAGIQNGLRIARRAYNQAAQQISQREKQILDQQQQHEQQQQQR
jgi:hypothetical protein